MKDNLGQVCMIYIYIFLFISSVWLRKCQHYEKWKLIGCINKSAEEKLQKFISLSKKGCKWLKSETFLSCLLEEWFWRTWRQSRRGQPDWFRDSGLWFSKRVPGRVSLFPGVVVELLKEPGGRLYEDKSGYTGCFLLQNVELTSVRNPSG